MKKLLFVANLAKEHINKFHIPTIRYFKFQGWQADVACGGDSEVPECDNRYYGKWKRSPFTLGTLSGALYPRVRSYSFSKSGYPAFYGESWRK